MYKTLSEIRASSMVDVIGVCADSQQFLDKLNDVTERLMMRGDWSGLVVPIQVCIYNGCVVWPRYVHQVRKMNMCFQSVDMENMWFNFLPTDFGCSWGLGDRWWGNSPWGRWCGPSATAVDYGRSPVFQDVRGEGRLLRLYARCQKDLGKTQTVFGIDNAGQELHERDSDDNWTPGITLTLQKPFASSSMYVRRVDRVVREETQCPVDFFAYNAADDVLETLAQYEPGDINPSFSRLQINGGCCNGLKSVIALVKLKFIPVKYDSDIVFIDNRAALKKMVQSVQYESEGDIAKADAYEMGAIRDLNRQLGNDVPLNQLPIRTFSAWGAGQQKCF